MSSVTIQGRTGKRRLAGTPENGSGARNVDSRLEIQLMKMEEAAQDRAGWSGVVCGFCFTGSDKA